MITSDERTNAVIVSAEKDRMPMISELIKKLDVNVAADLIAKTIQLRWADATQVADSLNQIFVQPRGGPTRATGGGFPFGGGFGGPGGGGFGGGGGASMAGAGRDTSQSRGYASFRENVVVPDVRTNSLIVTASKEVMAQFEEMVKKLDVETTFTDLTRYYRLKYAKAEEVANTLNQVFRQQAGGGGGGFFGFFFQQSQQSQQNAPLQLLRQITVVANVKDNSVLVAGPPSTHSIVEDMINKLDRQVPQVFIDVMIVDVTLSRDEKLGFQFNWQIPGVSNVGTDFGLNSGGDLTTTQQGGVPGFRYSVITKNFNAVVRALASRSDTKIISRPRITTMDNVTATITVGTLFPFVQSIAQSPTGNVPQFSQQDIGITLTATPHVNPDDQILMDVDQTVNDIASLIVQAGFTQPVTTNRHATTTIQVKSGETIVIGGMIQDKDTVQERKVPLLGDLPIIKTLFRDKVKSKARTEILVFITPHVVRTDEELRTHTEHEKQLLAPDTRNGLTLDTRRMPVKPEEKKK